MKRLLITALCASILLISGCIEFRSVDQPISASVNEVFTVGIETYTEGGDYSPYFGICLPIGWSVPGDSIPCTGVYNEAIYYDSSASIDQENASPAPEGYCWWAGSGPGIGTPEGIVSGDLQIQTGDQLGCYSLDYMLGNSYGGVNRDRSDGHVLWVVDDYTPTGLQAVEGDNSVIMNWRPPVHRGGLLGYNIYRDQEIINTGPIVDTTYNDDNALAGVHRYAVSALYHNGDEHLTPYEVLLFFGQYAYVSPDGDNSNDGSSYEDAFLTITYALSIIKPDSLHLKAILLAPGVYSPDSTGEEFPISFINYQSLVGAGDQASILDANNDGGVLEFEFVHDVSVCSVAVINGGGRGISCHQSNPNISNISISDNSGDGIFCLEANPAILNNTISGNTCGIGCYDSSPEITNTIVWGNYDVEIDISGSSSPIITYCDIPGGWEGEGNIDVNPLFVDPDNSNYNVCSQSPCIDAGDPDLEDPDGTRSDIGVFHAEHAEYPTGNIWHVSTAGNDTTGDGSPGNPFRTIQHGIDVSSYFDTVVVETGTYMENITIFLKNTLLASNYIFSGDTLDIQNTIIDGNSAATVVTFEFCDSLAAITGFTIINGNAADGGGIRCHWSSPLISYNYINGNSADGDGGGICCVQDSDPTITGNIIRQNIANVCGGGISCRESDAAISGNTIRWNWAHYGGGIMCWDSDPVILNNTISENSALYMGGGIHIFENATPEIDNTIFWENFAPLYGEISGNALVSYCNIQDTLWPGEGNISIDPLFRDPDNGDFHLMSIECGDPFDSPCIDAGDPGIVDSLLDCLRGLGTILSDMGAYGGGHSVQVSIEDRDVEVPMQFALAHNFPNPFNASTIISYSLPEQSGVTIQIYDILGRRVETLVQGEQSAGYHQIMWDANNRSSGLYFCRIVAGEYAETRKMVLLK